MTHYIRLFIYRHATVLIIVGAFLRFVSSQSLDDEKGLLTNTK